MLAVAAFYVAACGSSSTAPGNSADQTGGPKGQPDTGVSGDDGAVSGEAAAPDEGGPAADLDAGLDAHVGAAEAGGDTSIPGYTLTWSDEFNGPDGSAADATKWNFETGGGGWGNNELEVYASGTKNAVVQGGTLVITARKVCEGGCTYTSARMQTKGKFSQKYGRFVARIQIPYGQGIWPAFWMLGDNIDAVSWPACGEIDIMENIGKEPSQVHGSLHAPNLDRSGTDALSSGRFADDFHTYAIDWDATRIQFFVDDKLYETQMPGGGGTWAFDHPFFVLLNVAVGGTWPGNPDGTSTFPQTMKVDWVRAYQKNP
jgi:beta-glucanase (GH16 family)